jgi:hypothetical protein
MNKQTLGENVLPVYMNVLENIMEESGKSERDLRRLNTVLKIIDIDCLNNVLSILNGVNFHRRSINCGQTIIEFIKKPSKNLATNKKPLTKNFISGRLSCCHLRSRARTTVKKLPGEAF